MTENVATYLVSIRRRGRQFNIGAAVDEDGQVVILPTPNGDPLPLSMHEATQFQMAIREAVQDASMRPD